MIKENEDQTVSITTTELSKKSLPVFITFDPKTSSYSISPTLDDIPGPYKIAV